MKILVVTLVLLLVAACQGGKTSTVESEDDIPSDTPSLYPLKYYGWDVSSQSEVNGYENFEEPETFKIPGYFQIIASPQYIRTITPMIYNPICLTGSQEMTYSALMVDGTDSTAPLTTSITVKSDRVIVNGVGYYLATENPIDIRRYQEPLSEFYLGECNDGKTIAGLGGIQLYHNGTALMAMIFNTDDGVWVSYFGLNDSLGNESLSNYSSKKFSVFEHIFEGAKKWSQFYQSDDTYFHNYSNYQAIQGNKIRSQHLSSDNYNTHYNLADDRPFGLIYDSGPTIGFTLNATINDKAFVMSVTPWRHDFGMCDYSINGPIDNTYCIINSGSISIFTEE